MDQILIERLRELKEGTIEDWEMEKKYIADVAETIQQEAARLTPNNNLLRDVNSLFESIKSFKYQIENSDWWGTKQTYA